MNLLSVKTVKNLLQHNIKPSKYLGQNFLINAPTLNKIIETANISLKNTILEIGPGIGTLTQALAQKAKRVIAIEKDSTMVEILKETLKDYKNIEIIRGNALKIENQLLNHYKVVANIPYYITSPIIRMFLETENQPEYMILMVQKEVAKRICSAPPRMSLLAVSVQFYAKAEIISIVSKNCFWPAPKVDSAIIKITPLKKTSGGPDPASFFKIVKAGFSQPRKQLSNNLSKTLKKNKKEINEWLVKNEISPKQRAETLTIENWINLTKSY